MSQEASALRSPPQPSLSASSLPKGGGAVRGMGGEVRHRSRHGHRVHDRAGPHVHRPLRLGYVFLAGSVAFFMWGIELFVKHLQPLAGRSAHA